MMTCVLHFSRFRFLVESPLAYLEITTPLLKGSPSQQSQIDLVSQRSSPRLLVTARIC